MGSAQRGKDFLKGRRHLILAGVAVVAVIAAIVAGISLSGSPTAVRRQRMDDQRLNRLRGLSYEIQSAYDTDGKLPRSLDTLPSVKNGEPAADPLTGKPYEYRVTGDKTYDLCADFELNSPPISDKVAAVPVAEPMKGGFDYDFNWRHGSGHHCFSRQIQPSGWPNQRQSCGTQAPCAVGYDCVVLPDAGTPVCVKTGTACDAAGCPGSCATLESYPIVVRCQANEKKY